MDLNELKRESEILADKIKDIKNRIDQCTDLGERKSLERMLKSFQFEQLFYIEKIWNLES